MNQYFNPKTVHPDIPEAIKQQPRTPLGPVDAQPLLGLPGLPTIVATGPFDDRAHAQRLAAAFVTVRRHCEVQLVLLGTGAQRTTVLRRTAAEGFGSQFLRDDLRVHPVPPVAGNEIDSQPELGGHLPPQRRECLLSKANTVSPWLSVFTSASSQPPVPEPG